LLLFTGVNL